MFLTIVDTINKWINPFRSWLEDNNHNPFFWAGVVLVGLAVFALTYDALNKDK